MELLHRGRCKGKAAHEGQDYQTGRCRYESYCIVLLI